MLLPPTELSSRTPSARPPAARPADPLSFRGYTTMPTDITVINIVTTNSTATETSSAFPYTFLMAAIAPLVAANFMWHPKVSTSSAKPSPATPVAPWKWPKTLKPFSQRIRKNRSFSTSAPPIRIAEAVPPMNFPTNPTASAIQNQDPRAIPESRK